MSAVSSSEESEYAVQRRPDPRSRHKKSPHVLPHIIPVKRGPKPPSVEKRSNQYAARISDSHSEGQSYHETRIPERRLEQSCQDGRRILQEPNRLNDLDTPPHAPSPEQVESMEDLLSRLKSLERENDELKNMAADQPPQFVPPPVPHYTWRVLYYIDPDIFLESPQWKEGERGPVLHASKPLQNIRFYLEQHPEIAFVVYKDYDEVAPNDNSKIMSKDGVFRIPEPSKQALYLTSDHMIKAVEQLARHIPDFAKLFPNFNPEKEISAPYMFIYHSIPLFDHVLPHITPLEKELLDMLVESVIASHGKEYKAAKQCQNKGIVSRRLVKYLVRPGDVLVRTEDNVPRAYVAVSWAREGKVDDEEKTNPREGRSHKINAQKDQGPRIREYRFDVVVWSWAFNGSFRKERETLQIQLKVGDEDDEVSITSLNYFPLRFDKGGLQGLLEKRGKMFWKCRTKHLVSYSDDDNSVLGSVSSLQKDHTMLYHL